VGRAEEGALDTGGSRDRTEEIARTFEPEIQVVAYEKNRGCGGAIRAG
jgi:glycosyltransferase involved in cell wall biosynthesis